MNSGRILIVADSEEKLRVLHGLLKAEGYTVLTAMRGDVALRAATAPPPPELVLLDARMPGLDGYEICRRLRKDAASRDIPVIFMSAGGDVADKVEGFRSGGVDYVTKPFQAEEVLARVATHLTLSRQRREIAGLSKLKDQLIRTISDELKNPLTVVLGATELLMSASSLSDADIRSLIADVHHRGQDMLRLVRDLLDLSRIEEGMPLDLQDVSLTVLLAQQALRSKLATRGRGVVLKVEPPADEVVVNADRERIGQVVANLVSNAIKYTPSGGTVTLSAGREGDYGFLTVRDTGLGIPQEAMAHLFEPFYRVPDPEHRQAEGTGLGLTIVKAILDQHQGDIRIESEPGQGSRFTILLRLHPTQG